MKLSIPEPKLNSEGQWGGEERTAGKRENWMGKCLEEKGLSSQRNIWIRNQI